MAAQARKKKVAQNGTSFRQYLRSAGAVSTLLGFSTIFTFAPLFVPAISVFFLGLLLCLIDLTLESLRPILKLAVAVVLIAFGILMGKYVVFHSDPIDFFGNVYAPDGQIVLGIFDASNDTDYQDFDITIETEPKAFLDSVQERTGAPSVQIFDNDDPIRSGTLKDGQSIRQVIDPNTGRAKSYLNFRRVRFPIPKDARVEFKIKPMEGEARASYVHFFGTYRGKFQIRKIDYRVELTPTQYGLLNRQE